MQLNKFKILIPILLTTFILTLIISLTASFANFNQEFNLKARHSTSNKIDILKIIDTDNKGTKSIPPQIYLASENWKTVKGIDYDITSLNKQYPDSFVNFDMIVNALTINAKQLNCNDLDELYERMNWAEDLNSASTESNQYNIVYSSISGYWMDFVSNKLNELNKINSSIKYEYRFRYLKTRLSNHKYFIGQGNSNFEKVILYVIDNRWTYLLNRFYFGTSWVIKLFFMFGLTTIVYAYYCLIQKHFLNK